MAGDGGEEKGKEAKGDEEVSGKEAKARYGY